MMRLGTGVVLAALALASTGANCGGGNSGGDPPEKTAAVTFQLKVEDPKDTGSKKYQIDIAWHGELASGNGTAGNANPFDIAQTYEGFHDSQGEYIVKQLATNERPGTWHLRASANGWVGECSVTLPEGQITVVNFTYLKAGCMTGALFP